MEGRKAVIFGATGATGRVIAQALLDREIALRVVSRSATHLERDFGHTGAERVTADLFDAEMATHAADGCDVIFQCVGLPMERYTDHVELGRVTAQAMRSTGAACVLVSGYWSYGAGAACPINEQTERRPSDQFGGARLEQERILLGAGARVAVLPDFYGPGTHGVLMNALEAIASGKPAMWFQPLGDLREYVYVPDLGKPLVDLALREGAEGERFVIGGAGGISAAKIAQIAGRLLGCQPVFREVSPLKLTLGALLNKEARSFKPVAPIYRSPAVFDDSRFRDLFGGEATPYEQGIPETLRWLRGDA
ncbi:MAG: NAD(P)H-binding protein [Phycisphaeraceae bacterium]|nr:NAD(P)H-binding protein [Phycisphaeraceae bacterium]